MNHILLKNVVGVAKVGLHVVKIVVKLYGTGCVMNVKKKSWKNGRNELKRMKKDAKKKMRRMNVVELSMQRSVWIVVELIGF